MSHAPYPVDLSAASHNEPLPDSARPLSQLIVLNSEDRIDASTTPNGRYRIKVKPVCKGVFAAQFKSFTGTITPYNVSTNSNYRLTINVPNGGSTTHYFYDFQFTPGDWTLQNILDVLNDQPYLRFTYNITTSKVICEDLSGWTGNWACNDYPTPSNNTIGALIGFPQGITSTTGNPVQSTYTVSPHTTVGSILIAFDVLPTTVLTSGGVGAGFHVPVNHNTYNSNSKALIFSEQTGYFQTIRLNNTTLDTLGVRILDAKSGSPFVFVGPHIITLNLLYTGASA